MSTSRTGLLIIRARCEETSSRPLRAHIRHTTDISTGFQASMTLTQVTAVNKTVDTWLHDILTDTQPPTRHRLLHGADRRKSDTTAVIMVHLR